MWSGRGPDHNEDRMIRFRMTPPPLVIAVMKDDEFYDVLILAYCGKKEIGLGWIAHEEISRLVET